MTTIERIVEILHRVVPAVALFSMLFALDGGLRWLGLLGFVPLLLWGAGRPTCAAGERDRDGVFPCF